MPWTYYHIGTDQAPIIAEVDSRADVNQFDTKEDAIEQADADLVHSINALRRSRSALRRGEYITRKGDLK